jgi:membrane associated rhomboid family serine protease
MNERMTPVNTALIVANVVLYLLQLRFGGAVESLFALQPLGDSYLSAPFHAWQLVTYGFLHSRESIAHIFFNMFALYMFGGEIERLFGSKRYAVYYFACVVGAALMHLTVTTLADLPTAPMVGASGGVFGLLLAFGMAWPQRKLIFLLLPIPMPAWLFVTLYGAVELYSGITQTAQGIAHFAHLGGMVTGFVLIRYWRAVARRPR